MKQTSLIFLTIAFIAFILADVSVTTYEPWRELKRMGLGLVSPDISSLLHFGWSFFNTISFALVGISAAIIFGGIMSLYFEFAPVRLFAAFIRAIHEIFWAFLFMPLVGLNSLCGILAIAVPYAGVFAKVYAEIRQEADSRPAETLPALSSRLSSFLYTTLPIVYKDIKNYTSYRFECALRSSAVLGFIGLPTLGYHLETAFREGMYSEAAALLYAFYLLIFSLRLWTKPRFIILPFIAAVMYTDWGATVSFDNIIRFLSYDIVPWPMREAGFYDGSQTLVYTFYPVASWFWDIVSAEVVKGAFNTIILTQIALAATAAFTLLIFPLASKIFFSKPVTGISRIALVVLRTTPEYMLAYIFLQLWGPSMLPAIVALVLHNGGILGYLTANNVNTISLPFDSSKNRMDKYFYEILPQSYGQFLAFLFYRWEVILRESAILGILGVYTLGYYIDSAISKDHLDVALILIIFTAILNMMIDSLSQGIRKRLRVSVRLSAK